MSQLIVHSAANQVAAHLREQIFAGMWGETIPGGHRLGPQLGVNHKTVETALQLLEKEGLLVSQGAGRPRRIVVQRDRQVSSSTRIALLLMDVSDRGQDSIIELRHLLEKAGHVPFYSDKTLIDLGMDAGRVGRLVKRTEADAWVVGAGSREVLHWFCQQPKPAFALFGRRDGLPIAGVGPDKAPALVAATRYLLKVGHRRITFLVRKHHRLPEPVPGLCAYLRELSSHGIQVGDFNLPDWEESRLGFQSLLESLFHLSPPSAMIIDEPILFAAAQQFVARRGLQVPEDVSLICTDDDQTFDWCEPSIARVRWDYRPVVQRAVRWAANISSGKKDLRQTATKAEFVNGGTVGPAKAL